MLTLATEKYAPVAWQQCNSDHKGTEAHTAGRQPCQKWCQNGNVIELLNEGFNHISFIFCTINGNTRVGTLIVTTIYLQLIQNRYMFRSFTVLQCSHQHCVQPVASDVEVVGYL